MSLNLELSQIISFFKMSYKNKQIFVKYKTNPLLLQLLEVFIRENAISGFFIHEDFCYIYLKYNSLGEPVVKHLEIKYKRPFVLTFKHKQLKTKEFLTKYFSHNDTKTSTYIFLTDKGLLSYNEMLTKKIGGTLLLLLKYTEI